MDKPIADIWIYYGSEIKGIIYSGLIQELVQIYEVRVWTRDPDRLQAFLPEPSKYRVLKIDQDPPLFFKKLRSQLNQSQIRFVQQQNNSSLLDQKPRVPPKFHAKFFDFAYGNKIIKWLCHCFEKWIGSLFAPRLEDPPDIALIGDVFSAESFTYLLSLPTETKVYFLQSNLREFSKGVRCCPPRPCEFLCWDSRSIEILSKHNPWLKNHAVAIGPLQFDYLKSSHLLKDRATFATELGLNPDRTWVCYSETSFKVYQHDPQILNNIIHEMKPADRGQIQIIVRMNPTSTNPGFKKLAEDYADIITLSYPKYDSIRSPGMDPWHAPTFKDSSILTNIITHCDLNLGLPSSMFLDFAALGKPTFFLGFEPAGTKLQEGVTSFFNQEVFKNYEGRNVFGVLKDPFSARKVIGDLLSGEDLGIVPDQAFTEMGGIGKARETLKKWSIELQVGQ